jgi:2-hydroxy-3-oxopropionate reductase
MGKKIGFIGLGIMGKPMAENLLKAGYSLVVFDVNKAAVNEVVAYGAEEGKSSKDVAMRSEIVITMLPNSPHVKQVIFGENGVIEGAKKGTIIIDMSSIDPMVSREISAKLKEKGIDMLDAPVSGGEPKAIDGTLSIMAGGPEIIFNEVKEILMVMGDSVVLVGNTGSGNVTKLANQIIVALNIAAMSEAFVLAAKAGVNAEKLFEAIKGGLAGSTVLNAKAPMVLDRDFRPGFRIELHIKDLMNAMDTAHVVGSPLPLTSQVLEMMQALKVEGKEKNDHSSLIQYYERLAKIEVTR